MFSGVGTSRILYGSAARSLAHGKRRRGINVRVKPHTTASRAPFDAPWHADVVDRRRAVAPPAAVHILERSPLLPRVVGLRVVLGETVDACAGTRPGEVPLRHCETEGAARQVVYQEQKSGRPKTSGGLRVGLAASVVRAVLQLQIPGHVPELISPKQMPGENGHKH